LAAESIAKLAGRIVSAERAKALQHKRPAAKPKPPPAVLQDGKHFSRCPAAAAFDPNLTDGEVRCLAAAGAFTDKTGTCRASQATIARRLGVTRQNVHRWFTALVASGYLRLVRRTKRANGSNGPNVYQLVYPPLPEMPSERSGDTQEEGAEYPASGKNDLRTSAHPDAIGPRQLHG